MYVVLGYYNSSSLLVLNILYKGKRKWIYISAFIVVPHTQGAQVRITQSFTYKLHHTWVYLVSIHQMVPPQTEVADI